MSFVIVEPEALAAAASDLTSLGSTISAANAAAATPTTSLLAAGGDEVSAAIRCPGLVAGRRRQLIALLPLHDLPSARGDVLDVAAGQ